MQKGAAFLERGTVSIINFPPPEKAQFWGRDMPGTTYKVEGWTGKVRAGPLTAEVDSSFRGKGGASAVKPWSRGPIDGMKRWCEWSLGKNGVSAIRLAVRHNVFTEVSLPKTLG